MATIKAIVFDVDHTLLDTHQFIYQGYIHTLNKYNLPLSLLDDINSHMGTGLEKIYKTLAPHISTAELIETHRRFQENNLHLAIPFPNTAQTLHQLKELGIRIAAATSRSKRTSEKTLQLTGIHHYIETIISEEDVPNDELKPHPRPVLLALERLKIGVQDAVMVGDSHADITAGKRAGTKTVGVTYGALGAKIKESNPDFLINDIADIVSIINNKTITR